MSFDPGVFVADCLAASRGKEAHLGVREVVERAFDDPSKVLSALGEPTGAGITPLYRSEELTVINVVWKPGVTIRPHDHRTWAVIGVYTGREDNIFWRRLKDHPEGRIEAAGAKALSQGDVAPLGRDIIHSVTNPIDRLTGAIHVYGGDFFAMERSEWDPGALTEGPYDMAKTAALFSR